MWKADAKGGKNKSPAPGAAPSVALSPGAASPRSASSPDADYSPRSAAMAAWPAVLTSFPTLGAGNDGRK